MRAEQHHLYTKLVHMLWKSSAQCGRTEQNRIVHPAHILSFPPFFRMFRRISPALAALLLAASAVAAHAIGVQPLRTELSIAPGATKVATLEVVNPDNYDLAVRPQLLIYEKNDEQGFPVQLQLEAGDTRDFRPWVTFQPNEFTLKAGEKRSVTATVRVPAGTTPGGRYAAIVYDPIVNDPNAVVAKTRVASLLLIEVEGQQIRRSKLLSFGMQGETIESDKGAVFAIDVENQGNVHLRPRGTITITDTATGKQLRNIARYKDPLTGADIIADAIPVNILGGNVLPGSRRVFTPAFVEGITNGSYRADLAISGGDGTTEEKSSVDFTINEDFAITSFELVRGSKGWLFTITGQNDGNIAEKLTGKIVVKNEFDYQVAEVPLPEDMQYFAPGQTTTVEVPWLETDELPDGEYNAVLQASYGLTPVGVELRAGFGSSGGWLWVLGGLLLAGALGASGYYAVQKGIIVVQVKK